MGLFDEIVCEYALPPTGYRVPDGHAFQTKDLGGLLERYTITPDGRLVLQRVAREEVPEEERPWYGTPKWEEPLFRWAGSVRTVPLGAAEIPHHGDVRFYDAFQVRGKDAAGGAGERVWLEYRARFTEGRVAWVEVEEVRPLALPKTGAEAEVEREVGPGL